MYLSDASNNKFIRGRMDINNNVTAPQSSGTLDDERTSRHFFKILWQEHLAAHKTNLKEVSRHLPRSRASSASSAHIDRCVYYSGAKSFVNNGRHESFLE